MDDSANRLAFEQAGSSPHGLSAPEASRRLAARPKSRPGAGKHKAVLAYLSQFKSPILVLLMAAAAISGMLGDRTDSLTILAIIFASSVLSFYQEFQADSAVRQLLKLVETQISVRRDGKLVSLSLDQIVPGDVAVLQAGSSIPGDGLAFESASLLVNESALTGESAPAEKLDGDELFAGTHVQSGSTSMLVLKLGKDTQFGEVAEHLQRSRPEPQFHQGIRRYGYMLMEFTLLLALAVFAVNVWMDKKVVESLLFSLALAVGLTPQLLPAIMSLTLARGARQMAADKVIVKRLEAIEDFGSMNVLCSDKTGTLTQGTVTVAKACDPSGNDEPAVLKLAQMNALAQKGFDNPIDAALAQAAPQDLGSTLDVRGTLPYDFFRRRQSVLLKVETGGILVCKGAVENVLRICTAVSSKDGSQPLADRQNDILRQFEAMSDEGLRVLGVAVRRFDSIPDAKPGLESDMEFAGLIAFDDPLRADSAQTVADLKQKGVQLKLITGDNRHVAAHVAKQVGLDAENLLSGALLRAMGQAALVVQVRKVNVFAEVDPVQKERIISACRKAGMVVGYIGDGINDGPALHAADVGISVSSAVDVAKEAADFVMMERGLGVICKGIEEGRRIFANTLKYVFITTSANFGNMFSMAAASAFLPFLPLLPMQILLNNFLTDIPAMGIAGDAVDPEMVSMPRRWDVRSVRTFMIAYGLQSSVFDMLTFATLLLFLKSSTAQFRTGWFLESALSEIFILLVIRTRRPFFKSRPGKTLWIASLAVAAAVLALPYLPIAPSLGMTPLSPIYLGCLFCILALYALSAESLKHFYFKHSHGI